MPDWSKEVRAAIASLNLEPAREAAVIEELSQDLRDRYEEMLTSGMAAGEAGEALLSIRSADAVACVRSEERRKRDESGPGTEFYSIKNPDS